ncbi:hypothetical protein O6H91_Y449500 [Diphasiastrum complanatum]|nr:hypothetical protein O6H91_Y449500 [Diphasiastrum complanatum]
MRTLWRLLHHPAHKSVSAAACIDAYCLSRYYRHGSGLQKLLKFQCPSYSDVGCLALDEASEQDRVSHGQNSPSFPEMCLSQFVSSLNTSASLGVTKISWRHIHTSLAWRYAGSNENKAFFHHGLHKQQFPSDSDKQKFRKIPTVSSTVAIQKKAWMINRRHHMGHSHHQHGPQQSLGGPGERVARLGLVSDIALAIGKTAAGYISGSTAIIADAAHSISDVVLSGVALWSLKAARAPKDKEHPYGHGKFETLGALGISSMLLVTGGGIAWHALEVLQAVIPSLNTINLHSVADSVAQQLHVHEHGNDHGGHQHGIDMEHQGVALCAAIVSIGVKEGLYWITKSVGDKQGSQLLKANAWHHRSDAISSIVALIGVGGAMLGVPFLDPLAGLLVSGMIIKAGLQTGYQSLQELVDMGSPESELGPMRKTVLSVQGVEGCHDLRGRRAGSYLYIDAHVEPLAEEFVTKLLSFLRRIAIFSTETYKRQEQCKSINQT